MRAAQLGAPRQSAARGGKQAARDAERRFPVRIRIAVPDRGLGDRLNRMQELLDQNAGANGWALTPSGRSPSGPLVGSAGIRGVLNDALSIHLADATIASAFVARWCARRSVRIPGIAGLTTGISPVSGTDAPGPATARGSLMGS
jgi:hypothetical protein